MFFSSVFTFCGQIKTQSKKHFCCCACNTLPTTSNSNANYNFYNKNSKINKTISDKKVKTFDDDQKNFFVKENEIKVSKNQNNISKNFFHFQNIFYKTNNNKEKKLQKFDKKNENQNTNLPSILIASVSDNINYFTNINLDHDNNSSSCNIETNDKDSRNCRENLQFLDISLCEKNSKNFLKGSLTEKLDSGIDSISNISTVSRSELTSNLSLKTDLDCEYKKISIETNKKTDYLLHIPLSYHNSSSISSINTDEDCLVTQKSSKSELEIKNSLQDDNNAVKNLNVSKEEEENILNKIQIDKLDINSNSFDQVLKNALLQVSIDTMAITALPLNCWLKKRLKNWVQLSGHEGTIVPISNYTLWKKQAKGNSTEAIAYAEIMRDSYLKGFTPKFFKEIIHKSESFIEIQDLLSQFPNVSSRAMMDIKIGTRTFLESEVLNSTKRHDLYQKMFEIAPHELTEEEKADEAITKLRYMQFREKESSTALLGFRFEAAQLPGGKLRKCFKKICTETQILEIFSQFFSNEQLNTRNKLVERLKTIRDGIERSHFFKTHEVVGSSLLIIYDEARVGAWMIDFAKTSKIPDHLTLNHRSKWIFGNHEDGYLTGLDNLITILEK